MTTLTDEEIRERESELRRVIESAQAELEELAVVKRYMARRALQAAPSASQPSVPLTLFDGELVTASNLPRRPRVLSEAIVWALRDSVDPWMTANEIKAAAEVLMVKAVPMSSISPNLTDLKNKGTIVRREMRVALQSRVAAEPPM